MKVLVIEDDSKIANILQEALIAVGWSGLFYSDLEPLTMVQIQSISDVDLIFLDRMVGDQDAINRIPSLKAQFPLAGLIVISAIGTPDERANAIENGADDYIGKPFYLKEVIARSKAVLKRAESSRAIQISFLDLWVNRATQEAKIAGSPAEFTKKELDVLVKLLEKPGKIFSKADLIRDVWGVSESVETKSVEVTIKNIRRKLEQFKSQVSIRNERTLGYWLEA